MCSFSLDFDCAKLSPSLKLDFHHHLLTFFKDFNDYGKEGQDSYCKVCGKHCDDASVYRCVQCHFNLHLKCVVPSSATHKYHIHSLTMMELIKEDDSEKYYCDVCENERNPKDPVYYCQSCTFIAHIQCVLDQDKVASGKVSSSSPPPMENKALFVEQNEGSNAIRTLSLFRPIIHPHQMYEVTEELKGENYCSGCRLVLDGASYFCKTSPDFYLHEKCAKLSYEIRHSFHSSHPLNFYASTGWLGSLIACDVCRDICDGFIYFCEQCNFKLDMKCAALTTHKSGVLEEKMTGRITELHHFTHPHKLVLANCNYDPKHNRECNICRLQILGPAYFCPEKRCNYIVHESCLRLPQKIRVPFHPNHMLVSRLLHISQRCYACTLELSSGGFAYSCEHCDFNLHITCANSLRLRQPLKCEFHLSDLYYFGRNHFDLIRGFDPRFTKNGFWFTKTRGINFKCELCDGSCEGEPFYQDDSGKYYCDFCEEERNPNDDIYYCEECKGQTIAHIECVLAEVEDNTEIRKNIHEELEILVARFMKFHSNECRPPIEELIQAGVVPRFVELLGSPSDYDREQAVLALGNIAAFSLGCRDLVLGHGALLPLLALLNEPVSPSMLRNATWTLSRFCKPPFDQVKLVLPTLARLINSKDEAVLAEACWVLSYLSDGTNDKIQAVIEAGVLGRLVELLMHPSYSVITPALDTTKDFLGLVVKDDLFSYLWANLVATKCIINHALPCLLNLLKNNYEKRINKFACWAISSITTGNKEQAIIEANIIAPLVHLLKIANFDIRKEAAKAISNVTSGGTHDQIRFLVSQGCIRALVILLYYFDPETVTVCLQGLENILKVGEADKNMGITGGVNPYAQMIPAYGRKRIENLLSFGNTEVSEKAVKVLKLLRQSSILQG
ncbi:Armadillo [Gossypium australe]|uniref:Armadillo n=1 Tax=Gossypium australe TaxID=47621 RepID=A0A5B6VTS9_9ROSI|nr:Armadillo [Gossypium australe]